MSQISAVALAISIVAILISLPAVFLSMYVLVLVKAKELSEKLNEAAESSTRDPIAARELEGYSRKDVSMYELGSDEDYDNDALEDFGV